MAGTLNKVMLIGNLGKDPEARRFENGGMLVKFPIATTENFTDRDGNRKESTEWHTIVVRSPRLAEVCERFLHKGDKVRIIRHSQMIMTTTRATISSKPYLVNFIPYFGR
jgi:single-strand DNA-binding protein